MTRKHFIAMAAQIKSMTDRAAAQATADTFCAVALDANPRFDRARFLAACGL